MRSKGHLIYLCVGLSFVLTMTPVLSLPQTVRADLPETNESITEPQQEPDYVPGEVLVLVAEDVNETDANDLNEPAASLRGIEASVGGEIKRRISLANRQRLRRRRQKKRRHKKHVLQVKLPQAKTVEQAIAEEWGRRDARILSVEPNYRLRALAVPNDPLFPELWGLNNTGQTGGTALADIDAVSAWDITTGSSDVIVAIIDTGIDYLHPDLIDNMWVNSGEIASNGIDDDNNGYIDDIHGYDFVQDDGNPSDQHGHGTHCAGTIGGRGNNNLGVAGVNWQCKLMAGRFLNARGSGTTADAIDAINYAVANGADILSNSWGGGGYSATLKAAITNACEQGVLFVAAAGNSATNNDVSPHYPSNYQVSNVISVAATDHRDALAGFSCYGQSSVHLGAPGVNILSCVLDDDYDWYSGTSMATPHVSGVAALLLANDPAMPLQELKARIIWTGERIPALNGKTISGRRLNAYNALTAETCLRVMEPNDGQSWVQGFSWQIKWMSIGGGATVDIYLLKDGYTYAQLADDIANEGTFTWDINETFPVGSDYSIFIEDAVSSDQSNVDFEITDEWTDYLTEIFDGRSNSFDLSNKSLLLTPEGSSSYSACIRDITELPSSPARGLELSLSDDDFKPVTLINKTISLYGTSYSTFYVGSNGYITFGSGDTNYFENITKHFSMKRISALFDDLNPSSTGKVSWKQLGDRAAVTWKNVPEYSSTSSNTFQVEMFFDGRIRLSWLGVGAQDGIIGLSDGLGLPADFNPVDLSEEYSQCEPELTRLEITGPGPIEENSGAQFTCTAYYDDGSTEDVTDSNQVSWSDDSDYAQIDSSGYLTAGDVETYNQCTIAVDCSGKSAQRRVIIKGDTTQLTTLNKCEVGAGRTARKDYIECSGTFGATIGQLRQADKIDVKIYSADNYLVYSESINFDPNRISRGCYSYRHRLRDGAPGYITSFEFNLREDKFWLKARRIDLMGLSCPLFVEIGVGDYIGVGKASERVVNGRNRRIPLRLMRGYADALRVRERRIRTRSIEIRGVIAVAEWPSSVDLTTEDVTITWGSHTFTIPAGSFYTTIESGQRYECESAAISEGGTATVTINLKRSTFKVLIRGTHIMFRSGRVDFGIAFDNFDQTIQVKL
ncbi:MAG: S8 family serine peptidase [Planctomycetota bacterium]|jgi:subtilisin family serine protease